MSFTSINRTNRYDFNSASHLENQLWNILPNCINALNLLTYPILQQKIGDGKIAFAIYVNQIFQICTVNKIQVRYWPVRGWCSLFSFPENIRNQTLLMFSEGNGVRSFAWNDLIFVQEFILASTIIIIQNTNLYFFILLVERNFLTGDN